MNRQTFPLKTGCFVTVIFLILFFLNIPSLKEHPFYFLLWLIGLFSMPVLISFFFGLGIFLGSYLKIFTKIFRFKRKSTLGKVKDYYDVNNGNYINIDKYNTGTSENNPTKSN